MASSVALVWFRRDLRLSDHPGLTAAARESLVVPVYLQDSEGEADWREGSASRWWLHQSLASLAADLARRGSRLILRRGGAARSLVGLAEETGARTVYWHRRYEPHAARMEREVERALTSVGIRPVALPGTMLTDPESLRTRAGEPFRIFTPFWRTCVRGLRPEPPLAAPRVLPAPSRWPAGNTLDELALAPVPDRAAGLRSSWVPGEAAGLKRMEEFAARLLEEYEDARDRPDRDGSSRLSPHLRFGEISVRQAWAAAHDRPGGAAFLRQLGWREFGYHLMHHFPDTVRQPLRPEFGRFPWQDDPRSLRQWQRGLVGYPLVDAGMRELWQTGWMHNRVRMVVASFLVKNLLIPWQEGARWFWDTLVDADLANNTLGWQWTAGCGADAAPFFRIFNPVLQGERFDPQGEYVRRWVPELRTLPAEWIHRPWEAPPALLAQAGVTLGSTYPEPLVDHPWARERALKALAQARGGR